MKKILALLGLTTALFVSAGQAQTLVAGWDFQTTATGGTAVTTQDSAQPSVFNANFGSGTLYLDGTQGSSSWVSTNTAARELNAFAGTAVNTNGTSFSSVTTSPAALALVNSNANGKIAVFKFSLTGFTGLSISLAAQRTATGFTNQAWEWSTDGTTYSSIGNFVAGTTAGTIRDSFANTGILSFSNITALDNAADAYVRVTFTGATTASGNNRIDNVQFTAVPEPSTYAMLALSAAGVAGYVVRRRRR